MQTTVSCRDLLHIVMAKQQLTSSMSMLSHMAIQLYVQTPCITDKNAASTVGIGNYGLMHIANSCKVTETAVCTVRPVWRTCTMGIQICNKNLIL